MLATGVIITFPAPDSRCGHSNDKHVCGFGDLRARKCAPIHPFNGSKLHHISAAPAGIHTVSILHTPTSYHHYGVAPCTTSSLERRPKRGMGSGNAHVLLALASTVHVQVLLGLGFPCSSCSRVYGHLNGLPTHKGELLHVNCHEGGQRRGGCGRGFILPPVLWAGRASPAVMKGLGATAHA